MMTKAELFERLKQTEWTDFEVKEALDKLPKNVWESVSSFSNTHGGWIVFGVKERRKLSGTYYEIQGVNNIEKLETDFTNTLRGGQKFNQRIASQPQRFDVDGKTVVAFYIPMSEYKPVYIGTPSETYIRLGSSDQHATQFEVNALLRDQSYGKKSNEVVIGTSFNDINQSSFQDYRNYVRNYNASLKYNALDDEDFCIKTGIVVNGMLTIGGLLMFGKLEKILEFNHDFVIDYIEIPGSSIMEAYTRYTYRMQEQENIWDYFQAISYRLRTRLDNPYSPLPNGFAPDDESQMYCVREALVNFLAHADYFSEIHSTVRIYDNCIEFQNPGSFPVDLKMVGLSLVSQPRNPNILRFFKMAKLSENGGYGIDKINEWEQLTGGEVTINSHITYSEVKFTIPTRTTISVANEPTVTTNGKNGGKNDTNGGKNNGNGGKNNTNGGKNDTNGGKNDTNGGKNNGKNQLTQQILTLINTDNQITIPTIAQNTQQSIRTIERTIAELKKTGKLLRVGSPRNGKWLLK